MILLKEYMSGPWSNPWSESRPRSWFWYRTGSRSESRSGHLSKSKSGHLSKSGPWSKSWCRSGGR